MYSYNNSITVNTILNGTVIGNKRSILAFKSVLDDEV